MPLRYPLKQYGDFRQYPYPPTAAELASELADVRDQLAVEKMKSSILVQLVEKLALKHTVHSRAAS